MSRMNIQILGGGWITTAGKGQVNKGDVFYMPQGELVPLRRQFVTEQPDSRWGRLDRYSKVGLIGASLALKDAEVENNEDHETIAVVVSTSTGSGEVDLQYYQTVLPDEGLLASPNLFAYTLPNCVLGEIAIRYGLIGPGIVVNQTSPDMMEGIVVGARCLYSGYCQKVVAGYCNVEFGLDQVHTEFRPGGVFLVMQKTTEPSFLVFNNGQILHCDQRITNIVECMEIIMNNLSVRSSE